MEEDGRKNNGRRAGTTKNKIQGKIAEKKDNFGSAKEKRNRFQTDKQFLKSMDGQDMTDSEGLLNLPETTAARCVMLPSNLTAIRFKIGDEIRHDHIAHEIFHAVTFIMERVGMEFIVMKSDEAYAYLIGYITKKVYEILNKK